MPKARRHRVAPSPPAAEHTLPFRLGVVPGTTPGKWVDLWRARRTNPITLVPMEFAAQRAALDGGEVDAALVRLPIERDGLQVIRLYDDAAVVVTSADSHLAAADALDDDDLAGEIWLTPADDVLQLAPAAGTIAPSFGAPATTADAIATVATGTGMVVVVPMSLARLHHRRDTVHRPLRAAAASTVALVWPSDRQTADVDAFIGIVRGRTAHSSR